MTTVVARYLAEETRFLAAVEKGMPAADCGEFIEEEDLAESTVRTIYERTRSLKTAHQRGVPGYRSGTRELKLTPPSCVVVYSVKGDEAVEILHVHHGAQDWR